MILCRVCCWSCLNDICHFFYVNFLLKLREHIHVSCGQYLGHNWSNLTWQNQRINNVDIKNSSTKTQIEMDQAWKWRTESMLTARAIIANQSSDTREHDKLIIWNIWSGPWQYLSLFVLVLLPFFVKRKKWLQKLYLRSRKHQVTERSDQPCKWIEDKKNKEKGISRAYLWEHLIGVQKNWQVAYNQLGLCKRNLAMTLEGWNIRES